MSLPSAPGPSFANLFSVAALVGAASLATACGGGASATTSSNDALEATTPTRQAVAIQPTAAEATTLATEKATCPFVGAVVAMRKLKSGVLNTLEDPLAAISDIVTIGDTAGGNLGSTVLKFFAEGNQHFTRGETGALDVPVPVGTFSLDFPGSQGAHPGHSGILLAGDNKPYAGQFNQAAFDDLTSTAITVDGEDFVKRSDIGKFIAHNLENDIGGQPTVLGTGASAAFAKDIASFAVSPSDVKLARITGADNMVGSSGEFGLLLTFLDADSHQVDGEPAVRVADLTSMFVNHELPSDWQDQPKTRTQWIRHTTALLAAAELEYRTDGT